jgi:hypothetical protein
MAPGLKSSTLELLKRFNRAFPQFYEQFVSSEIQLQNLKLAYQVYQTKQAVIDIQPDGNKPCILPIVTSHFYSAIFLGFWLPMASRFIASACMAKFTRRCWYLLNWCCLVAVKR